MNMRVVALFCCFALSVFAHKLNLFVYDENGTVFMYAYFTKSSPCQNCSGVISDINGDQLAEFMTDGEGKAEYVSAHERLKIKVDGQMGHLATADHTLSGEINAAQKTAPNTEWYKLAVGILLVTLIFGALWLIKRRR